MLVPARLWFVFYFLISTSSFSLIAAKPPITEQELVRRTQEMMDAVATGNQEPWEKYYADDCIVADEKGRLFDKAKLVADIKQLPTGYSGVIKIEHVLSRIIGDTAILSYDLNETETIFGQELHARYHEIDTWMHRNGNWQIIATQVHRYYEDPAAANPSQLLNYQPSSYVGTYEVASGQTRRVSVDNEKLFVERNGKREQLFPEAANIFFRQGVEGRILFRYDSSGKVDALIDRRNNEDVIWRKVR